MTALPKQKPSTQRQGSRRAAQKNNYGLPHLIACPHCQQPKRSHRVCPNCGYYNNRPVTANE